MKKLGLIVLIFIYFFVAMPVDAQAIPTVSLKAAAHVPTKMPLLIGIISDDIQLTTCTQLLSQLLACAYQKTIGFQVDVKLFERIPSKKEIRSIARRHPVALFLCLQKSDTHNTDAIEWHVYDTKYAKQLSGKRINFNIHAGRKIAEFIADDVWYLLTGNPGFFQTRIAYCVVDHAKKPIEARMCITPSYIPYNAPDSNSYRKILVGQGRPFAPRWHTTEPLVFYSEPTKSNVRLLAVDLHGNKRIVSNFDGLNVQPSFSMDGKRAIYCLSHGGKSHLYDYHFDEQTKKYVLERLTHEGNNIAPNICENGDIIFCSDFQGKGPKICLYHAQTKEIEVLTPDGYCMCPHYNSVTRKMVYSKSVNGILQLFCYDLKTKEDQQITFDLGNKEEPSWSPCGNFIAFSIDTGNHMRIAIQNMLTQERTLLTPPGISCSYPNWSPIYQKSSILS